MGAVTDHINKDMREFLYADGLAILGNSWEDVSQKICQILKKLWKAEVGKLTSKKLKK